MRRGKQHKAKYSDRRSLCLYLPAYELGGVKQLKGHVIWLERRLLWQAIEETACIKPDLLTSYLIFLVKSFNTSLVSLSSITVFSLREQAPVPRVLVAHLQYTFKVTRPSYFLAVPPYFEALWYPHLCFYRKFNTQNG